MQAKHLIIIAIVGIVALIAFNILNGSGGSDQPVEAAAVTTDAGATSVATTDDSISSQPLGQQPKAMLDKASASLDQAQQAENDKIAQAEQQSGQ